jgi:transcriptional regulator with GAF, ATPase, and Fis domain
LGFLGNLHHGAIGLIGAAMTEARKFDEALVRFERAIARVEQSAAARRETVLRLESLEKQASSLQLERTQLDNDLGRVRAKAAELVDTSKKAAGKIDSAVSRIRAVLYSNSGGA